MQHPALAHDNPSTSKTVHLFRRGQCAHAALHQNPPCKSREASFVHHHNRHLSQVEHDAPNLSQTETGDGPGHAHRLLIARSTENSITGPFPYPARMQYWTLSPGDVPSDQPSDESLVLWMPTPCPVLELGAGSLLGSC